MAEPKNKSRTWSRLVEKLKLRPRDPDEVDEIAALYSGVQDKRVDDALDSSKKFLPHGCVDELIPDDTVARLLKSSNLKKSEIPELLSFIFDAEKPAKQIFVIAVYSGFKGADLSSLLLKFKGVNFWDGCLPITNQNRRKVPFFIPPKDPRDNAGWIGPSCNQFESSQWLFLAPVFKTNEPTIVLPAMNPLPFTRVIRRVGSGGFGVVHKATVHEAHRKHEAFQNAGNTGEVALKEVNEPGLAPADSQALIEGGISQEAQALEDLRGLKHPHLIEFISTIHRGQDQHYLMFLWANGQDLGKYWYEIRSPKLSVGFVKRVIQQCHGLVDGLKHLHTCDKGMYRHTDIKPANILRFVKDIEQNKPDLGTLKISDMGLAKKHTMPTSLRKGTVARAATTRYQPPEAVFALTDEGIGRRYDVWSMGCVMLELVIWLLYGSDTLEQFNDKWLGKQPNNRDANPYYERKPQNYIEVQSVVTDVINSLLQDQECRGKTAIGDLLRVVKHKMLVVKTQKTSNQVKRQSQSLNTPPPNASLQVPPQASFKTAATDIRAYSWEVLEDLNAILHNDRGDSYWFTGMSRDKIAPLKDPRRSEQYGETQPLPSIQYESPMIQIEEVEGVREGTENTVVGSLGARSHGQTHLVSGST